MDTISQSIFNIIFPIKPDRINIKESEKDSNYHAQYGRWCVGNGFNTAEMQDHMRRIAINKAFYVANKQWSFEEDVNVFLRDSNNNETNRVKVELNMIQIMGNQYIGNVKNMSFNAKASSYSPMVKTRKEDKLAEMQFWTFIAKNAEPTLSNHLKETLPIGDTQQKTAAIFENLYVDTNIRAINGLLKYSETINRFEDRKKFMAEQELLSGAVIMHPYVDNGEYMFRPIPTERFFFDRTAYEYDLSDADYMGHWEYLLSTDIYERFDLDEETKGKIESFIRSRSTLGIANNKIATFNVYWRDCVTDTWGWVKDDFDNPFLSRIDHTFENEEAPRYKMSQVMNISELSPYQLKVINKKKGTKGKAIKRITTDQWRYCIIIPAEIIGLPVVSNADKDHSHMADITLDYGIVPFQEPDLYCPTNMQPPYKVNFYMYVDGGVYSPVDIVINPQRIANRMMSVMENIINNSGASGLIYDKDMVEDEAELLRNTKEGKPIGIRSKGLGIPNVTGKYDNTPSTGATNLASLAQMFLGVIEKISGVNDVLKGQNNNNEALVGVTQLMLQRGSVIQQRFYDAIENVFKQCYQAVATSGKRLYIENKKKLISQIGDNDAEVIELDPSLKLEDIRVRIIRSMDTETERKSVDAMLIQLMQIGLLDNTNVSNLIGRGDTDDMWTAVRQYAKMLDEQKKVMAEQQAAQAQGLQQQAAQQQQQTMDIASAQERKQDVDNEKQMMFTDMQNDKKHQATIDQKLVDKYGGDASANKSMVAAG